MSLRQHSEISISPGDTALTLLPSKMAWWPDQRALIFADSHFGKASTFRRFGIPVPAGTTATMLARLSAEIKARQAAQIIIVGDFIHSAVSAQSDYEADMRQWREQHRDLRIGLVRGNHDRRTASFYAGLAIDVFEEPIVSIGPLDFCHLPDDARSERFTVCGHLHPSVNLRDATGKSALPCFVFEENRLTLPAFGEFTGGQILRLPPQATAYVVCEQTFSLSTKPVWQRSGELKVVELPRTKFPTAEETEPK